MHAMMSNDYQIRFQIDENDDMKMHSPNMIELYERYLLLNNNIYDNEYVVKINKDEQYSGMYDSMDNHSKPFIFRLDLNMFKTDQEGNIYLTNHDILSMIYLGIMEIYFDDDSYDLMEFARIHTISLDKHKHIFKVSVFYLEEKEDINVNDNDNYEMDIDDDF